MVYELDFKEENYYRVDTLPANPNEKILYVFRDTTKSSKPNHIEINKILYIGISLDAEERLNSSHNKKKKLKNFLRMDIF